jgi:mRNA interferase MazF
MRIRRGDVVLVNLDPVIGKEQGRTRPAVVVQNDIGNEHSPTTIIAPITSKVYEKEFPTNVLLKKEGSCLPKDSTVLLNQLRTIDQSRIIKRLGSLDAEAMRRVSESIKASLDLP